jgi:hypothetical protein
MQHRPATFNLRSGLFVALFGTVVAAHGGPAAAQITFDGCRDARGIPVASIPDNVPDVAVARLGPGGEPVIFYNPVVLSWFAPQTRLFWYGHECGHHALGHLLAPMRPGAEQEADCFGIEALVERGLLSDRDVTIVQADLARVGPGDWAHLPGGIRSINLRRCLGGLGATGLRGTPRLFCCDGFGNRWCEIPPASGPAGSPCWCAGVQGSGRICG